MKIRLILLTLMLAVSLPAGIILTVNPVNPITELEGNSIGNTLLATSNDSAPTPGPFSATINWGDGTTSAGTPPASLAGTP